MDDSTAHRVGVYGWSPGDGGVHHHRIAEPLRVLGDQGVTTATGVELDDDILSRVDTVLAHTLHGVPESEAWHRLAQLDTHRLVLDVDDAMWSPDWPDFRAHYTPEVLDRLMWNVRRSHVVTTPSPVIAEHLAHYNTNVWVVPNTVPAWLVDHEMPAREHPTVGYQGSPSHAREFRRSMPGLGRFLAPNPDWHLALWGPWRPDVEHERLTVHPWANTIDDYYRSVSMDVGIGPLADTKFNRSKSSLRAVEYAALGIVAVLPDLPPYRGWVEDGVTGRLIRSGQTMRGVLHQVAADPDWRAHASKTARERASAWTTEASIGRWVEAWNSR